MSHISKLDFSSFETVVIDNASHDDSSRQVAAAWGVRYVQEKIVGLSRARNRGLAECKGEIVAYVDDDAIPERDWLSRLVEAFKAPDVMAVTGGVRYPNDAHLDPHDPLYYRFEVAKCAEAGVDRETPDWFEIVNFGGVGIGANMAFRRKALEEVNGFEVRLGRSAPLLGNEETYAFFSMVSRGYRVIYAPQAVVYHPCGAPRQELRERYLKDLYGSAAYASFLFFEEPQYRHKAMDCALRGVRRNIRRINGNGNGNGNGSAGGNGHSNGNGHHPRRFTRSQLLIAAISGPFLYFRSFFTNGSS